MAVEVFTVGAEVALLTIHGKAQQIEPVFDQSFACKLRVTDRFNTDNLGSFDGKTPRTTSPIETALKKAYLACELTGLPQGLGSEGSFHSHITGSTSNTEIIAFVDTRIGLEIFGFAQQFVPFNEIRVSDEHQFQDVFESQIEPLGADQKWLLIQSDPQNNRQNLPNPVIKGLSKDEIITHIQFWPASIEPDFRAMNCPHRQHTIMMAAKDLVNNIQSSCPKCNWPNFIPENRKHSKIKKVKNSHSYDYLACESCGAVTTQIRPPSAHCDNCDYSIQNSEIAATASAYYCTVCNP